MRLKLGCFFLCVTLCLTGFAAEFVHYGKRVPSTAGGSAPPLARGKAQNFPEKQDRPHKKNRRRPSGFFQLTWVQSGEEPSDDIKKQRLLRRINQRGRALPFAIEMFFPDSEEGFSLKERSVDTTHDLEEKALDSKIEAAGQANDWEEEAFFSRSTDLTEEEGEGEAEEEFFGFYTDSEEGSGDERDEGDEESLAPVMRASSLQKSPRQNDDDEVFGFPEKDLIEEQFYPTTRRMDG